jgi:hypothetical protein
MLATRNAVETVDVVVVAKEVGQRCQCNRAEEGIRGRCLQRFRGAYFLPSAQAIRAKMGICSEPQ